MLSLPFLSLWVWQKSCVVPQLCALHSNVQSTWTSFQRPRCHSAPVYESRNMLHVFASDLARPPSVATVQQLAAAARRFTCLPLGPDHTRRHVAHPGCDANQSKYIVYHAHKFCTASERFRAVQSLSSQVHISRWTGHLVDQLCKEQVAAINPSGRKSHFTTFGGKLVCRKRAAHGELQSAVVTFQPKTQQTLGVHAAHVLHRGSGTPGDQRDLVITRSRWRSPRS